MALQVRRCSLNVRNKDHNSNICRLGRRPAPAMVPPVWSSPPVSEGVSS
jgi:hypothetical protein